MFQQLPMFQCVGDPAFKKDLSNTLKLDKFLGYPHRKFKAVHVAGTNGKGSVSHMLASVFQEAGYKTGLYTSPHLKDFRERIKINGKLIPEKAVIAFINQNKKFLEDNKLSFFEMTVGMAFEFFADQKVDIAIVEVGMGGRFDSTNILNPELSIITNIGLDHTRFLGNSLAEIASEKGGIIKPEVPVVIGEIHKETQEVFRKSAEKNKAEILFAEEIEFKKYDTDLKGNYQKKNMKSVLGAIRILREKSWNIPEEALLNGLDSVKLNTGLQGRWDVLQEKPKVICDTAHNAEGLKMVFKQLRKERFIHLRIVLGMLTEKDLDTILPLFPKTAIYYFCTPDIPRGLNTPELQKKSSGFGLEGRGYDSVSKAYDAALNDALDEDLIFVGGSTFTVAEII